MPRECKHRSRAAVAHAGFQANQYTAELLAERAERRRLAEEAVLSAFARRALHCQTNHPCMHASTTLESGTLHPLFDTEYGWSSMAASSVRDI